MGVGPGVGIRVGMEEADEGAGVGVGTAVGIRVGVEEADEGAGVGVGTAVGIRVGVAEADEGAGVGVGCAPLQAMSPSAASRTGSMTTRENMVVILLTATGSSPSWLQCHMLSARRGST